MPDHDNRNFEVNARNVCNVINDLINQNPKKNVCSSLQREGKIVENKSGFSALKI